MPILPRLLKPLKQKRKGRGGGIARGGGEAELGEEVLGDGQVEGDGRGRRGWRRFESSKVRRFEDSLAAGRLASCVLRLGAFDLDPIGTVPATPMVSVPAGHRQWDLSPWIRSGFSNLPPKVTVIRKRDQRKGGSRGSTISNCGSRPHSKDEDLAGTA